MILFSEFAECTLIGSILFDAGTLDEVRGLVNPDDFFQDWTRQIYTTACGLQDQGREVDIITLGDELQRLTGDETWFVTLTKIIKNTINAGEARGQALTIAEYASLRRLLNASTDITKIVHHPSWSTSDKVAKAQDLLTAFDATKEHDRSLRAMLIEFVDHLETCSKTDGGITGIATGFMDWDQQTKGLHGGELIIVAARPGMGKTNFALNIADKVSKRGNVVMIFSLEMSGRELLARMASCSYHIEYANILSAKLTKTESDLLTSFVHETRDRRLIIDDDGSVTMADIRSRARRARRSHGKVDLIVVDYLQLISGSGDNRRLQIEEISRGLKMLAKELDCPVIALSQLSRKCEERNDKRPLLSDLRESGSIEQDADVVSFIYRDEAYDESSPDKGLAELLTRKLRHGQAGTTYLETPFNKCLFTNTHRVPAERTDETTTKNRNSRGMEY